MRRPDEDMLDPEIVATLDAIDATLAGEPVDPRFAEIAELSLLLSADRPAPDAVFARDLDERVAARFARRDPETPRGVGAWLRSWSYGAFGAASAATLVAIVAVVLVVSGGSDGQRSSPLESQTVSRAAAAPAPRASGAATPAPSQSSGADGATSAQLDSAPRTLQPPANGRKIIQSATLFLGTPPTRVDDVAQEVFNVIGSVNGIVDRSSVTATGGPDGNAQFALRVPSGALAQTMSALSRLHFANVVSRTDNTQDVNTRFVNSSRELADARALRAALVKQLAAATTQSQIDSLKAQLASAEGRIASAQAALRSLNRQVDYSRISLTIQASAAGGTKPTTSGRFGLHTAAHDAVRVLTVALGVALIALAVLVPASLLALLAWWGSRVIRRRRREQALDLA